MSGFKEQRAALCCIKREVAVLGAFLHLNIIWLISYTALGDKAAVLAGRVELCLLFELAARGGLDENLRAYGIASGFAKAISYLHCHDPNGPVFHRDVKSANVALMSDMTPKLIDCGLAKYTPDGPLHDVHTVMTASSMLMGTHGYQCRS